MQKKSRPAKDHDTLNHQLTKEFVWTDESEVSQLLIVGSFERHNGVSGNNNLHHTPIHTELHCEQNPKEHTNSVR